MDKYCEFLQEISNKSRTLTTHAHKYGKQYQDLLKLNEEISSKKEKISKKIEDLLSIKKGIENSESAKEKLKKELKEKIKKRLKVNGIATAALGVILVICTIILLFTSNFSLVNVGIPSLVVVSHFILKFGIDLIRVAVTYKKQLKNHQKIKSENNLEEVIILLEVLQKSEIEYVEALNQNQEQLTSLYNKIAELEGKITNCYSTIKIVNDKRDAAIQKVESNKAYESLINEQYAKKYCGKKIHPNLSRILAPQKKQTKKGVKNG